MNKPLLLIIGIVALVIIFFAFNQYVYQEKQPDINSTYFQEQLTSRALADIGQPIEGFDAGLLMVAFPGLIPQDFDAVQTLEGHYELTKDNTLKFVRDKRQPITSAEHALSDVGYSTLLQNVAYRLNLTPNTNDAVDALIDTLDTAEHVTVLLNETGSVFGVSLTPLEILEDSRCPVDVECIQAGTVRIMTTFKNDFGQTDLELRLGEAMTTEENEITLSSVEPPAHSETVIEPEDYSFTFRISKR